MEINRKDLERLIKDVKRLKCTINGLSTGGGGADIYVDGASFNSTTNVLTLTDNDGVTPDVVVNLGALVDDFVQAQTFVAFTPLTFTHNFNKTNPKSVQVQVISSVTGQLIIPNSISNYAANSLQVEVGVAGEYTVTIK